MTKLMYRVAHTEELRLVNTTADSTHADRVYDLFAIVVHVGPLPNQGHYIAIVRSHGMWLQLDDERVDPIDRAALAAFDGFTDTQLRVRRVRAWGCVCVCAWEWLGR